MLAPAVLLYATGLTQLQHLSLAGLQLLKWPLPLPPALEQLAEQDATVADDWDVPTSFECLTAVAEAETRERHVRKAKINKYRIEHQPREKLLADAWVPRQKQHQQQWQKLLSEQQAGMVFFDHMISVGHMALRAQERSILLDAVMLPQLQTLNLDLKPLVSSNCNPWRPAQRRMGGSNCPGFACSNRQNHHPRSGCSSVFSERQVVFVAAAGVLGVSCDTPRAANFKLVCNAEGCRPYFTDIASVVALRNWHDG